MALGALPAQVVYLNTMEFMKHSSGQGLESLGFSDDSTKAGLQSLIGGASASFASQFIVVPLDVISQRLMIQSSASPSSSPSSLPSFKAIPTLSSKSSSSSWFQKFGSRSLPLVASIFRQDGIRGFYRGFLPSLLTYLPSSSIYWGVYGVSRRVLGRLVEDSQEPNLVGNLSNPLKSMSLLDSSSSSGISLASPSYSFSNPIPSSSSPSIYTLERNSSLSEINSLTSYLPPRDEVTYFGIQGLSGILAGFTSVLCSNPMDVIKTRIQTMNLTPELQSHPIRTAFRCLIREEGWKGFTRGLTPRVVAVIPTSLLMVFAYETTKRFSVKS